MWSWRRDAHDEDCECDCCRTASNVMTQWTELFTEILNSKIEEQRGNGTAATD